MVFHPVTLGTAGDLGRVILLAGLIGAFATAVPVIAVVVSAGDLKAILRSPAPFSSFIASVAGPAAGHALSAGVIVAISPPASAA